MSEFWNVNLQSKATGEKPIKEEQRSKKDRDQGKGCPRMIIMMMTMLLACEATL